MKLPLVLLLSSILLISCSDKPKKQAKEKEAIISDSNTNTSNSNVNISNNNKTAVLKWDTELCSNTGEYDPEKYTEEELKNTCNLWVCVQAHI